MNAKEYSALALRTANSLGSQMKDTFHATLGMAGESGEIVDILKKVYAYGKPLDRIKLLEEIGDLMWYVNLYVSQAEKIGLPYTFDNCVGDLNREFNDSTADLSEEERQRVMLAVASKILTDAGRANLRGDKIEVRDKFGYVDAPEYHLVLGYVLDVIDNASYLVYLMGSSLVEVFEMNIRKLETRYPDLRFEADKAINRDVDAEQKVLQG